MTTRAKSLAHDAGALLGVALAVVLSGCTVGPDYARPDVPAAPAWRTDAEAGSSIGELGWWQVFGDETLQGLIRTALEENKDVRVAVARVLEARAQLGLARSNQFPTIDSNSSYSNQRNSEVGSLLGSLPRTTQIDPKQEVYRTTLDLSFELDLWGKLRRGTEAARAELLASEENRRGVIVTLVGDVAQTYFDLLELDRELDIARQTLDSRRESLRIVRLRFDNGIVSELDLRRAEGEVASATAQVPDLERRVAETENRLSVLLGRNPGPIARGGRLTEQAVLPEVPAGLPSALLQRRPDLRQAEQRLVAANARIGEAKAAYFPQVNLTGAFGVESIALSDLFTGPARVWQFGPRITIPIFNAGKITSQVQTAEARTEQTLVQYQQSVQQAFREVEDALVGHRKIREIRPDREALVAANRRSLQIADLRYQEGLSTYLDVLDAQRQLFSSEIDLARTTRDQLTAVVQLYKALGGGWTREEPSAATR